MKVSLRKVVEYYKVTDRNFNVYSFNPKTMRRHSAYLCLDCINAFQEMVNRSAEGMIVLCISQEGEQFCQKWEIEHHNERVPYEVAAKFAVKTYIVDTSVVSQRV